MSNPRKNPRDVKAILEAIDQPERQAAPVRRAQPRPRAQPQRVAESKEMAEERQADDTHPLIGEGVRGLDVRGVHFVRDSSGPRVSVVASVSSHAWATSSSS